MESGDILAGSRGRSYESVFEIGGLFNHRNKSKFLRFPIDRLEGITKKK